jgi:amino acid transporter
MNIVAIVGLRWIARSARIGAPSITLWMLACVMFFVPLAFTLVELSRRYPEQGGLYVWARRAFGPMHAYMCGWCMWVNNLLYFPSLLLFAAANLAAGLGLPALEENRAYSITFVLALLWFCTAINSVGLHASKWIHTLGSVATWLPPALLITCGAVAFTMFGSATSFTPATIVPHEDFWSTVSLWSAMCFAFAGFEITTMMGQEVRHAHRTIPAGIIVSGVIVTAIYMLSSTSILVAVPASELSERSGIADAIDLVTNRLGLAGFGAFTGLLLAAGSIGGTHSWMAGAARVPFAAGVDAALPSAFGRLHPRFRTPHVALIVQSLAASVLFLASVFVSLGGGETTIQEAYDIMVNLTILIYFVPYLYLFAVYVRLRETPMTPTAWLLAACGFVATSISIGLVFIPPAGTENVLNYEANLIGQSLLLLGLGFGFSVVSRRATA